MLCVDENDRPIAGKVEYVYFRNGRPFDSDMLIIGADGHVPVPSKDGLPPTVANVKPTDGHWSSIVRDPRLDTVCVCAAMDRPSATTWWRHIVGRTVGDRTAGHGIRIGIVDLGFRPDGTMDHIAFRDVENEAIDFQYCPQISHGLRVAKIIAERGLVEDREGVAAGSEVVFIDVSQEEDENAFDGELLGAAIELLVDEHRVDLINISAGYYAEPGADPDAVLNKSIAYARRRGAIVVAAVGNEAARPPAAPARFPDVVGVGAIGQRGVAPPGSHLGTYERLAQSRTGACGSVPNGPDVFHHIETSFGPGLDVVAPGIGLTLCFDQEVVIECVGTSYSCPLVVGVLACALGRDDEYRGLDGTARSDHALDVLYRMRVDLGMDPSRQGVGLPVLPKSC